MAKTRYNVLHPTKGYSQIATMKKFIFRGNIFVFSDGMTISVKDAQQVSICEPFPEPKEYKCD